ncbi:MAG: hypothetical protein HOP17_01580 [Acidobacteria bacterium]|nr:hypothetical protein [Acidobacteriota bacterium]
MLHVFEIKREKLRLWQAPGESFEHVLMKALAYTLFIREHPKLQVEVRVGLRYKPDLVAIAEDGGFDLWVECGMVSIAKTAWLLKHSSAKRIVIFKIGVGIEQLTKQLRAEIPAKYRPGGRLTIFNFVSDIRNLTASKQIAKVSTDWYTTTQV